MSDTSILGLVGGVLWGVVVALAGIIWALLQGRITTLESKVGALDAQNTLQETQLGRLVERTVAMADKHEQHRTDIRTHLDRLEVKIDRLLSGARAPMGSKPFLEDT
jgi:hypothetical protein